MSSTQVLTFLGVALLAYVTPGPDWFVVMRQAAASRKRGYAAALGVQSGLVVHMAAAASGVAVVLLASSAAFTALKMVGAAYLVFLGVQALRQALRGSRHHIGASSAADTTPARTVYRQAITANVLNPKAALFFVAVLPQFVDPASAVAPQVLLLGTLDIALGVLWWSVFVIAVGRVSKVFHRKRSAVAIDGVSGVALLGLGGALAFLDPARA